MAKTPKKAERDLVDRLRGLGLRKPLAKKIAHTATNVKGQVPDSARNTIREMLSKVDDLGAGVSKKHRSSDQEAGATTERDRKLAKKHAEKATKTKTGKKAKKAAKKRAA